MYRFHAQVAMGALLKDPTTGRVVALIEVDDGSHNAARDRIRDTMTGAAGYRPFRIPASVRPTIPAVLRIVHPLREDLVQRRRQD